MWTVLKSGIEDSPWESMAAKKHKSRKGRAAASAGVIQGYFPFVLFVLFRG
jgi:hypothetical protein